MVNNSVLVAKQVPALYDRLLAAFKLVLLVSRWDLELKADLSGRIISNLVGCAR